jgi:tRNA modification GTPase
MIDASSGIGQEDKEIFPLARGKKTLVLINKIDIKKETTYKEIEKYTGRHDIIEMSLLTGQGLEKLEKRIEDIAYAGLVSKQDELMVSNIRHKHTLERTACSMEGVISALEEKLPTDCMAIDLKAAWESLGEITGETVSEDLVDQIFSRFCIGK